MTRRTRIQRDNRQEAAQRRRVSVLFFARGDAVKFPPLIVYKGVPNARVEAEVEEYDDQDALHCVQENAWTDAEVLEIWCNHVLKPVFSRRSGEKVLLVDSLRIHKNSEKEFKFQQRNVEVRYVPEHCTAILQPQI